MDSFDPNLLDVSVLMVEDDTPSRIYCSKILKKLVREVYVAENGLEGLQIFQQNNIDIIVSDIGMPIMDGLEMSREIKKINKNTQIILTTALDNKNYLMQAIEIGINSYIVKPVQKDNLYEAVEVAAKVTLLEKEVVNQYESIRKLSRAVAQSPSMVVIVDTYGKIEYVNSKFTAVTKLEPNEVFKKAPTEIFQDLIFVEKYDNIFTNLNQLSDSTHTEFTEKIEFMYKKTNNSQSWLSASLSVIADSNNKFHNILILLEDVTEEKNAKQELEESKGLLEQRVIERTDELRETNTKLLAEIEIRAQAEQQLIKARDEAESANKAKSTFLAKVSHELRTPLNGIIGITSILLTDELSEKQRKFLDMVKLSADGLLDIINDILDFSKIEAGKLQLVQSIFSLRELVENSLELYRQSAMSKRINLFSTIEPDVPDYYISDAGRIRQIILNLISNALKFTENGEVFVKVNLVSQHSNYSELRFTISDTGIGIPDDKIQMLFQSFSQVDDSLTRRYGGTGLGLSICKEIIGLLGGRIWVESKEGVGSSFYFTLKMEKSTQINENNLRKDYLDRQNGSLTKHSAYRTEMDVNENNDNIPKGLKILIAEDSPINQEVLKQNLLKYGWDVAIANDGLQALNMFKESKFDLIFMDIQMPEMDGLQSTEEIRKYEGDNNLQPIIIMGLTAHAFEEQIKEAKQSGMNECVTKPFKFDNILSLITNYFQPSNSSKASDDNLQNNIIVPSDDDTALDFCIDVSALLKTLNNNSAVMIKIIDYFVANIRPEFENLRNAAVEGNSTIVRGIAHKMKSEVGNFAATNTVEICRELENKGKDADLSNIEPLLEKLSIHLDLMVNKLNDYKIELQ